MQNRDHVLVGLGWGELGLGLAVSTLAVLPVILRSNDLGSVPVADVAFAVAALVVVAVRGRHRPLPVLGALAFTCLAVYAGASALLTTSPFDTADRLVPAVQGLACMAAAYAVASRVHVRGEGYSAFCFRFGLLLAAITAPFILILVTGRTVAGRMGTSMGGAAVAYVVPLIALGCFLQCWRNGFHRTASARLAGVSLVMVVLTGSRAGFGLAMVLTIATVVDWRRARNVGLLVVGAALAIPFAATFQNGRLLSLTDASRQENYAAGLGFWAESLHTSVFGAGFGAIWPWYTYESLTAVAGRTVKFIPTVHGALLPNPHSLFVGIVAELGLVGALMLALVFTPLAVLLFRRRSTPRTTVASLLLVVLLPGFFVDYYLFKNFPVSFVWWAFYFATLNAAGDERVAAR